MTTSVYKPMAYTPSDCQCCGFRNGRMFGIIKGRIKHVFYGKKRSKKRNKVNCLKCSTKRQSTATHLESNRQPRPPPAVLLLYGLDRAQQFSVNHAVT